MIPVSCTGSIIDHVLPSKRRAKQPETALQEGTFMTQLTGSHGTRTLWGNIPWGGWCLVLRNQISKLMPNLIRQCLKRFCWEKELPEDSVAVLVVADLTCCPYTKDLENALDEVFPHVPYPKLIFPPAVPLCKGVRIFREHGHQRRWVQKGNPSGTLTYLANG